ncbi:substrate-binding domain-containing protein [Capsulimonas corticalis]|uniref:substrate-binding domain-containing protein n=1 Tax=Capsulimonas corticalis TaxID=2219043 RepID=UPI002626C691|nr:substrate-binding domain-containing protein [Capsulimonas corticalis]
MCPKCGVSEGQVKAGMHGGSQRYKCSACRRRYTPEPSKRGYAPEVREQAVLLHAEGLKSGEIARRLGVNSQSVRNWLQRDGVVTASVAEKLDPAHSGKASSVPLGKRRATINDVAARAEVSRATVSNFLNDKGRMSESTRSRIQTAMDDLHFTPSALVRAIRRQRTRILGVFIFGLSSLDQNIGGSLAPHLLAGISEAGDVANHNLLLYTGWTQHADRHSALEYLDGHIDGLIWVAPPLHDATLERVAEAGLPVVALLTRHVPDGVGYVNVDNINGVARMVEMLVQQGHRRIAYIGSLHDSNFLDRRDGYRKGLEQARIEHDPRLEGIDDQTPDRVREPSFFQAMVDRWLLLDERPTAVIGGDDGWGMGVGKAFEAVGLRVPEDVSITGVNDTPDAQWILGGLTTINQPFRQMGILAVERLVAMIEGAPVEDCRITVTPEIIVRSSSREITP